MSDEYLRGLEAARAILEKQAREAHKTVAPSLRGIHRQFLLDAMTEVNIAIAREQNDPTPDLPRELCELLFEHLGPQMEKERILATISHRPGEHSFKQQMFVMICTALDIPWDFAMKLFEEENIARQATNELRRRRKL